MNDLKPFEEKIEELSAEIESRRQGACQSTVKSIWVTKSRQVLTSPGRGQIGNMPLETMGRAGNRYG